MTWMLTCTGAVVDLRYMAADTISLLDIAHGLSRIDRFTGQGKRPYSVAEHSLLVVHLLEEAGVTSPPVLLAGLLHDAHEAYFGDMSSPLKEMLNQATGGALRLEERRIQHSVLRKFGVVTAMHSAYRVIHRADMTALSTERQALMPAAGPEWSCLTPFPAVNWDFAARARFTWQDWRDAFLEKFSELDFGLKEAVQRQAPPTTCA